MTITKSMINENRFFSNIVKNMGSKEKFAEELVENARRSGSKNISFEYKKDIGVLVVKNDGDILQDMRNLLIFAESDYPEEILQTENPAGAGIYLIMSVADEVIFHSGKSKLKVNPKRLLDEEGYRSNIFNEIKKHPYSFSGMKTTLFISEHHTKLVEDVFSEMVGKDSPFDGYLDINITYNSKKVDKKCFSSFAVVDGSGTLEGTVLMVESSVSLLAWSPNGKKQGTIYWHGKTIKVPGLHPFTIVVKNNHLFKPVLPDRTCLSNTPDEVDLIRDEIERQLQTSIQLAVDAGKHFEDGKQELLNSLSLAYNTDALTEWEGVTMEVATKKDIMFFNLHNESININTATLSNDRETVVSPSSFCYSPSFSAMEEIFLFAGIAFTTDKQSNKNLLLPQWVKERFYSQKIEAWIEQTEEEILCGKESYRFEFSKKITVGTEEKKKEISCLILDYGGDIYTSTFDLEAELSPLVEQMTSNSYETSEAEYREEVECDLAKLRGFLLKSISVGQIISELEGCLTIGGEEREVVSFSYDSKTKKLTIINSAGKSIEIETSL